MVLAYLFWQLWQGWGLDRDRSRSSVVLLVAAPILGAVIERVVMRPLYGVATNIRLAVTLGLLLVLDGAGRHASGTRPNTYIMPEFFNGDQVSIGGINLSYEQLITVGVAVAVARASCGCSSSAPAPAWPCGPSSTTPTWPRCRGPVGTDRVATPG